MVFEDYAGFYDLIYQEKDYLKECNFVRQVFHKCSNREVRTVLDLGCGTGSHSLFFSGMGYAVTGVDQSEKMLQFARSKARKQNRQIRFLKGDIRCLDLHEEFDAAVAMFNVLGYQTTNQDVENALGSVRRHLYPGGLFIFDVWFGPAVLKEKPDERSKSIEKETGKIIRYARPVLDIINQTIQVNYTVSEVKNGQPIAEVKESHLVRFFFHQELNYFLVKNSFEVLKVCPFMDLNGQVDEHGWNISVICKAV